MIKSSVQKIYEFKDFRLDTVHLMLYRGGEEISLAPKAVQTLIALIERRGEILGKGELMQRIWNDSIVEEANLTQYVHILRKILGTTTDGRPLIETLRRRGYRFNGEVRCVEIAEKISADEISYQSVFNASLAQMPVLNEDAENKIEPNLEKAGHGFSYQTMAVAASIGLLILAVSAFWSSENKQSSAAVKTPNITLKRLTPDQNAIQPTLSPDGKYMVYATLEKNLSKTLWLRDLTSGSEVQIMPENGQYMDFAFSADSKQIYYLTTEQNSPNSTLERIPLLGGKPQEILKNVFSPPAVSPDGKQIAVIKGDLGLTIINETSKLVYTPETLKSQFNAVVWGSQMSWSPDGERLAICGKENGRARILDFSIKDGTISYLPMPDFNAVDDVVWIADGSGLLVTAKEKSGEPFQIWRVAYPSGKAVRITRDFNDYDWLSLSNDAKTLVVEQRIVKSNIWSMPLGDLENARQLTFGSEAQDGYWGMAFAPSGKIIFTNPRSGNLDLWQMNHDGSEQQPLTGSEGSLNVAPRVTGDGRYIVFSSTRGGDALHLWRMDTDGRNPLQLTNGINNDNERFFDISQDGSQIYYATTSDQKQMTTRQVSINGGESSAIADDYQTSGTISVSPDGKRLLRYVYLKNQQQPWRYGIFPIEGGEPLKLIELTAYRNLVRWSADGKSLLYIKPATAQIWQQPIDGESPEMLLDLRNGWLFYFALSPDYKQIVFAQGNQFSEAVLIEESEF